MNQGERWDELSTRWTILQDMGGLDSDERERAWEHLYAVYWGPMLGLVRRRLPRKLGREVSQAEAEEVLQSFVGECFSGDWLGAADRNQGRFRSWIVTILDRYLSRHAAHLGRKKRNPEAGKIVSIASELGTEDSVEDLFDREWLRAQIAEVLALLRASRPAYHAMLVATMDGESAESLAARLEISEGNLRTRRSRARKAFERLFTAVVRDTVSSSADLEPELEHLRKLLGDLW